MEHVYHRGVRRRKGGDAGGKIGGMRSGARPVLRAHVDTPVTIQAPWAQVHHGPMRDADRTALDSRHVRQRQARRRMYFRRHAYVDIDGVNQVIAVAVATPVATGFPASREREPPHMGHDGDS